MAGVFVAASHLQLSLTFNSKAEEYSSWKRYETLL